MMSARGGESPEQAMIMAPVLAADQLSLDQIHVWWMPYRRAAGRAPLRAILGAYLHQPPAALVFKQTTHGRPQLERPCALHFNWSHSGARAMLAVAHHLPTIGVDVEALQRDRLDPLTLAERYFAPAEHAALQSLSGPACRVSFRKLCTAKEAVLKAHGHGLSYGLSRVAFAYHEGRWRPHRFEGEIGPVEQWRLLDWALDEGHASLAWTGPSRRVRHFQLDRAVADH